MRRSAAEPRAVGKRGIDGVRPGAAFGGRPPARARAPHANRQPFCTISRASSGAPRGRGRRELPRVALGQLAARDHPEHVVGQPRAAAAGSTPTASSGRRGRRSPRGRARTRPGATRTRGPPRSGERSSRATFSTRPSSSVPGHRPPGRPPECSPAGFACGAPAALARDQLVAARCGGAHDDRLHDALGPDRLRQRGGRLVVEPPPRLPRVRVDRHRPGRWASSVAGAADQHLEAAAETSAGSGGLVALDKLHRHLPVGLGAAPSGGRRRSRAARGSAPRRAGPSAARES